MLKKAVLVGVLGGLFFGGAHSEAQPFKTSLQQNKGHPPQIVDCYAAQVIRPGDTWMIFLRAEDQDGDMESIAAVLWQAGVGYYPTDVTMLKGEARKQSVGYLFLGTPPDSALNWSEFELTILVRDSQGNRSHPVKLPLRFDMAAKQEIPEKWQEAANHRLAALMINISLGVHRRGGR